MSKTLRLVSLKALTFAIVEYEKVSVKDPNTQRWDMQMLPMFTPITPTPQISKLYGNRDGQNFILTKNTYFLDEALAHNTVYFKTGEKLEYYKMLDIFFQNEWIQRKLVTGDLMIELLLGDNADKEVVKYLYEKGYITDDNINNHTQYVEHKEGKVVKKAKDYLYEDANKASAKSENDSVPHEVANSEMAKRLAQADAPETIAIAPSSQSTPFLKAIEEDAASPIGLPTVPSGLFSSGLPDSSIDEDTEIEEDS